MVCCKYYEEYVNYEVWVIFYVDLMMLLLVFFVVMYVIFLINEGKYWVMVDVLIIVFGGVLCIINLVQVGNQQVQGGGWDSLLVIKLGIRIGLFVLVLFNDFMLLLVMVLQMCMLVLVYNQEQFKCVECQFNGIVDCFIVMLVLLIECGMIIVCCIELWIEVEINSDILFIIGLVMLDVYVCDMLFSLVKVLYDVFNGVCVEGYIDNVLIVIVLFLFNWEFLVVCVVSVVYLFVDQGLQFLWLVMVGYGQFCLCEDNVSVEGCNCNCWVMVIILVDIFQGVDLIGLQFIVDIECVVLVIVVVFFCFIVFFIVLVQLLLVLVGSCVGVVVFFVMKE